MTKYEILSYLVGLTSGIAIMMILELYKTMRRNNNE